MPYRCLRKNASANLDINFSKAEFLFFLNKNQVEIGKEKKRKNIASPDTSRTSMQPIFGDHCSREWTEHSQELKQFPQMLCGEREQTGRGASIGQPPLALFLTCGRQHDIVHFQTGLIIRITEDAC